MIAKSIMVILELQEIYLCLLKDFYRSLYRQREPERKVCFKQNGIWGFLPQQGCKTVECTVINLIQRWERRKNVLGKRFFQVSGVRFKQQFQWPLWFLFQTKGSNLVQGYCCLLPASSFVLLGISLSLPRVWLCPLLGQQHLSSVTLRSAVLTGDFFFPPHCLFHIFSAVHGLFFFLWPFLWVSLFCVLFMLQYFCRTKHCAHYFTFLLSLFLSTHVFSLIFVPFRISSSYISFFSPLCHSFYTLSCSLLSDILLLSTALLYLPLDIFSPSCSFGRCPFPRLRLHIVYLNITYECVYIYLHIFHSPAETKKLLMLIVRFYFIPFSAPEIHCSCSSSDICIG